jgi:outer membrane biosynthesis protein TonB
MSPGWRISPALLAAIAAAALSFGVCFAVVADATRTTAPDRVAVRPAQQATPAHLALTPAPSLRVRTGVLPPPPTPVTAASEPPAQTTTEQTPAPTTTEQTPAPTTTEQTPTSTTTTTPATQAPKPTPKPKPKPKPKPPPQPSGPDFDDSGPQGPPSGG